MGVCRVIASAAPSQHIKRNYRKSIEKYDSNKKRKQQSEQQQQQRENCAGVAVDVNVTLALRRTDSTSLPQLLSSCCRSPYAHSTSLFTPSLFICMRLNAHRSRLNPLAAHRHAHKHRPREQTKAKRAKGSSSCLLCLSYA